MKHLLQKLVHEIEDFYTSPNLGCSHQVTSEEIRAYLQRYDFAAPLNDTVLLEEVSVMMQQWNLQVTSPQYFGLFNPSVALPSIVADTLTALYNPQLAVWSHAPAACEMERHILRFIGRFLYPPEVDYFSCFTTGGSEANLSALLGALAYHFPSFTKNGLANTSHKPTIYASQYAHHSLEKISKCVGLGELAVKRIACSPHLILDVDQLIKQIEQDRKDNSYPFLVVGTAGTTAYGTIDSLEHIAEVCKVQNLWFHVDAAWGGAGALSPQLRPHLKGLEQADSITVDAHKWFSVGMGAGMFFTRHTQSVQQVFSINADYMPASNVDVEEPYVTTFQWSRRFIGLKLFMTLASLGVDKFVEQIENQTELGRHLRERLQVSGFEVVNQTLLPVVCFTHDSWKNQPDVFLSLLKKLHQQGYWLSSVVVPDKGLALRACITSFKTQLHHIDNLVDCLKENI